MHSKCCDTELRQRPGPARASRFPDKARCIRRVLKGVEQNLGRWLGRTRLPSISISVSLHLLVHLSDQLSFVSAVSYLQQVQKKVIFLRYL